MNEWKRILAGMNEAGLRETANRDDRYWDAIERANAEAYEWTIALIVLTLPEYEMAVNEHGDLLFRLEETDDPNRSIHGHS